jgi:transcription initiation factor TFIID subunit 7
MYADDGDDYEGRGGGGGRGKKLNLKLSLKAGAAGGRKGENGMMTSFLGPYDRELDEDPKDPLAFEEQFILRVPREIAEGPNGLREMVKGKAKGLEGIEFKFLGT